MNQNFNQPNLDNLSVKSNSKLNGYLRIFWKKSKINYVQPLPKIKPKQPINLYLANIRAKNPHFFSPVCETENKREL